MQKWQPLEKRWLLWKKRIGGDSNQNKTFGTKVADMGKVGRNLCKKGCLQPLQKRLPAAFEKRLWQTACEKNKHLENKRVCYISFDGRKYAANSIGKNDIWYSLWKKTSSFKTGSQSQNLWQKGTCMLLQQVEPLKKRYGKASISQELLSRSSLAKFFCLQTSELAHSQPSKK